MFSAIGLVCFRLRDFKSALDAYRNAARYNNSNADHLSNAGACLCELKQFPQALSTLREAKARPRQSPESEVYILGNIAEVERHLGNHEAARAAYDEAARRVNRERPLDLFNIAVTAAVLGAEEDSAEFFALALAVASGIELGETPAIEFVLADPDRFKIATARSEDLSDALERVAARHNAQIPSEHQTNTQITLPHAALTALNELIEHPPVPTTTLRMVFDESRA